MAKYHLGLDGMPKKCKARVKPCPFGSIQDHFNTIEEGLVISDELNEQLQSMESFGIAREGNWQAIDKNTELAVVKLNNLRITMKRLENIQKNAKAEVLLQMRANEIKKLSTEVGTYSSISGGFRKNVDVEKLKEMGLYEEYSKISNVSEHSKIEVEDDDKIKRFERRMTTPSGRSINFNLQVDENGNTQLNEESLEALKQLKAFDQSIKRAKELEKELKNEIMESMKTANVSEIKVGKASLVYVPNHERVIVDSNKLKDDSLYEEFSKDVEYSPSLRVTYKKN